jgi:hypothetical protein
MYASDTSPPIATAADSTMTASRCRSEMSMIQFNIDGDPRVALPRG